jgi:MFS family permease
MASSLAFIDGSVVNVGLPAIGRSFHADAIGLQWVVNAYLLPLSALLLLGGAAGDRYGRRRLLIAGVLLFGIASLACAVAPTLILLLLARFVQGASAAMLMPNSLAILGQSFSGEAKGRAIGIWAATGEGGDPEIRRELEELGFAVRGSSADELRVMTRDQLIKYGRVLKEMGIVIE